MTNEEIAAATRAAFSQEAEELLAELDQALLALEASPEDRDEVNRVFRALHTLKGSGATAGFREIAEFLHAVENVYDEARTGKVTILPEMIDATLKVADTVRELLGCSPEEVKEILARGAETVEALSAAAGRPKVAREPQAIAAEAAPSAGPRWKTFRVRFVPKPDFFLSGADPFSLIRELGDLGPIAVRCDATAVPDLVGLDLERCYLAWEIDVLTLREAAALRDVFIFSADACDELTVEPCLPETAGPFASAAYLDGEAVADFGEEATEQLATLEADLLAMEQAGGSRAALDGIFRALHNIKGGAGLTLCTARLALRVGHPLRRIHTLSHAAETVVEACRGGGADGLDAFLLETLLRTADSLRALLAELQGAAPAAEVPAALLAALHLDPATWDVAETAGPKATGRVLGHVQEQCLHVLRSLADAGFAGGTADVEAARRAATTLGKASQLSQPGFEVATLCARVCEALTESPDVANCQRLVAELAAVLLEAPMPAAKQHADAREDAVGGGVEDEGAGKAGSGAGSAPKLSGDRGFRIDAGKLDRLMRAAGELLIARNALPLLTRKLEGLPEGRALAKELKDAAAGISRIAEEVQATVMAIRMLPVSTVFQRFPRMVRDTARALGKDVHLVMEGGATELDKTVLEQISDPLVHLVRNAMDHGLERPEERVALGKPARGTVTLKAYQSGSQVFIDVSDDGRGIDAERLRTKAVERGFLTAEAAAKLTPEGCLDLIFLPGFSTAASVSDLSGRGVGMDVVRNNITQMQGTVSVSTKVGEGTTVRVALLVSLMVSKGILVSCGRDEYILPIDSVQELVKVRRSDVHDFQEVKMASIRGRPRPVYFLEELLGATEDARPQGEELPLAMVRSRDGMAGIALSRFVAEVDVIVKPIRIAGGDAFEGASIMGDGRVVLVLNPEKLLGAAQN